jgi:glucan phosphorylase
VQCNPSLSALITETLKLDRNVWLKDLYKLEGLLPHVDDPQLQERWAAIKHQNKERLALYVERQLGIKVDATALFDVQIKRLHEYKRQTLNILGVIHVRIFYLDNEEPNACISFTAEILVDKKLDARGTKKVREKSGIFRR